jgi:hypothetical protein
MRLHLASARDAHIKRPFSGASVFHRFVFNELVNVPSCTLYVLIPKLHFRFYTLFVKDFGINVCMFVWDRFLFEGEVAVYRSCLAAFWCLREHLLAEGLQGVSTILQDPSKLVTTANFEAAYSRFVALDYQVLSQALHQVDQTVLLFQIDSLQMHFESSRPTCVLCTL